MLWGERRASPAGRLQLYHSRANGIPRGVMLGAANWQRQELAAHDAADPALCATQPAAANLQHQHILPKAACIALVQVACLLQLA